MSNASIQPRTYMQQEVERWANMIKAADVKPEQGPS
jgi:hypothetical protein